MGKNKPPIKRQSQQQNNLQRYFKTTEELVRIIGGSASEDYPGLLKRQRDDESFKKIVLENFAELKLENKNLRGELTDLKTDFHIFKNYFRLPTTKKFWKVVAIIFVVLIILSGWTRDAYEYLKDAVPTYVKKTLTP